MPCPTNSGPLVLDLQSQYDVVRAQVEQSEPAPYWKPSGSKEPLGGVASHVGSCVVVRRDGKPLDVKFMEALQLYGRYKIGDAIDARKGAGNWTEDILTMV